MPGGDQVPVDDGVRRSAAWQDAAPGQRWVLRVRTTDGSARDVTGWLDRLTLHEVALTDADGRRHTLDPRSLILARRVPAARGGRHPRRSSAEEVERHARLSWLVDSEPLGDWLLRSGSGFTGRANSAHAVGDPGVSPEQAAARVIAYAAAHAIAPLATVLPDSDPARQLRELGWVDTYVPTEVLVARLADVLGYSEPAAGVEIREHLEDDWLTAYVRSRPNDADPALLRRLLGSWPAVGFAAVPAPDDPGSLIGIARGHLDEDWLGVAAVWTDAAHRRRGLATAMLRSLGHWAARRGTRYAYLQVDATNSAAIMAYERLGFEQHHPYLYLRP